MIPQNIILRSCLVVIASMLLFAAMPFGTVKHACAGPICEGDFDGDRDVDGSDLATFAEDFGQTDCEASGLYYTKAEVDALVANLQGQIAVLQGQIDALNALLSGVTRDENDNITFSGVNVHIVNGTGATDGTVNGLGNLIVGYNELRGDIGDDRTGSHNVVVGTINSYSSAGGLVVGFSNTISGPYSSVSGGGANTASGPNPPTAAMIPSVNRWAVPLCSMAMPKGSIPAMRKTAFHSMAR